MHLTDKRDLLSAYRASRLCMRVTPDSFSLTNEDGNMKDKGGKPKARTTMLYTALDGEYLGAAAFVSAGSKGLLLNIAHDADDTLPGTRLETLVDAAWEKWLKAAGQPAAIVVIGSYSPRFKKMKNTLSRYFRHTRAELIGTGEVSEPLEVGVDPGQRRVLIYRPTLGETIRCGL